MKTRGFSLVSTLFLLVVVSGLAAYLVNLSIAQQYSTGLTVNALRGRHAALSGLEWVAYRIDNVASSCPAIPTSLTIEGFNVTVTSCTQTSVTEGVATYSLFDVTVTAERGAFGDTDYVNHAIRATLRGGGSDDFQTSLDRDAASSDNRRTGPGAQLRRRVQQRGRQYRRQIETGR